MLGRGFYDPVSNGIERLPTQLHMFLSSPLLMLAPHWHAQVEVNFIVRGWAHYEMSSHAATFTKGDLVMFWGGQPHRLADGSDDLIYAGAHLPLVHFFRMRLAPDVQARLMQGATLKTASTDAADPVNFARWAAYAESADPVKMSFAVDELLLRIERIRFEPFDLLPAGQAAADHSGLDHHTSPIVVRICEYIADKFRYDIDSADIAVAADVHPKYAMAVFKKSTGMTLTEYINLMRLSYAQALLMRDEDNVLAIAMESGFGSLSAFNKAFRKVSGMSPTDFRREVRGRPNCNEHANLEAVGLNEAH